MNLSSPPPLSSERLLLRRPGYADVDAICALANNWEVARWMGRLPFPCLRKSGIQVQPVKLLIVRLHSSVT